ncbi:MAG: molecular chaperone DnaK, partial [Desulfobacula sp.]|nr:molecular chaperone DnaK [Desulfobacula sp.]
FNGGTLKPVLVQARIQQAIGKWFKASEPELPRILENDIPELAVGIGASYYGLVKQGVGVRVGSGSPISYYLGVSLQNDPVSRAICLVERGLDEGSVIELPQMKYEVRANEPVSFDIYSSSYRSGDKAGEIISIDDSFSTMTPIQTIIKFGKNGQRKTIPVTIGAEYTEMGTLSMYCHSCVSDHRWKLQFQLRDPQKGIESCESEVYDENLIKSVCKRIHHVFTQASSTNDDIKSIARQVEEIVAQKKTNWPLSFLRRIADKLIELEPTRKHSADHEARWLNLTGFCMRPGFGDAFDEERCRKLWKLYLSGLIYEKSKQNRLEWWIFIRRIAAGLKSGRQRQFFQDISSVLMNGKNNKAKLSPREQVELWMTVGNMERLLVKDKTALAKALFPQLAANKKQDNLFWTLSRLGARELLYGSVDRVVPAREVVKWMNRIMKKKWHQNDPVENMIAQMSRKTGDRTRDLDQEDILRIVDWLKERKARASFIRIINERIDMAPTEKNAQFGEKLP